MENQTNLNNQVIKIKHPFAADNESFNYCINTKYQLCIGQELWLKTIAMHRTRCIVGH